MLTPKQLKEIPESFVSQIQELEDYIIADIARRIGKEGELTDTAIMQLNKALALGADINEMERIIRKVTGAALSDIDRVIREAIGESVNADNAIYKSAGYNPINFQKSPELMELLEAGIRQTKGEFASLTASMGFASMVGGKVHFQTIASFYQNAMNMAAMQVTTGALDIDSAVRYAVKKMADSGIRYVDYASGHVNRVDVAVRRAITSGINQLNLRLTDKIMEELGAEYVEVTAHSGARPDHKTWQGKVYHVGGSKDGYLDFVSSTGYGTGPGLGGWNCRHSYFPFFPEISVRAYTDEQLKNIDNPPFTYEGKRYTHYEATQRQRELETAMRKTKREIIAYDAAGLKNDFTAASIRLNVQKEAYKAFSEAAGLPMQLIRAEQYGFGKSISQKAAWARKNYYKAPKSGIIKIYREKLKRGQYPISQSQIDDILKNELKNLKFSAPPIYNARIATPGKTGIEFFAWGEYKGVTKMEIGKQYGEGKENLIDTLLHEELEVRLAKRLGESGMRKLSNDDIHDYINSVIERYFRMKGWNYGLVRH